MSKPRITLTPNLPVGRVLVISLADKKLWDCRCLECGHEFQASECTIKIWMARLKWQPKARITCRGCYLKRHGKESSRSLSNVHRTPHTVQNEKTGERRTANPICKQCTGLNRERPWNKPCACGLTRVVEKPIRAVATIGSAGAQCMQGVGYSRWAGVGE